ncbi:MAG TPA: glycosyltransferase family 39 protein [Spongiibacteraceae bacterium]
MPAARDWLFWFAAIALLFVHLGTTATWQSEDRWLEVAREMLLSGNYFKPTLNGALYFDKPLLGYWLIIVCKYFVGALNEWSLRLPSAIAGLIALWATIDLAKQLWGIEVARKAGWILLTCFGFLQWARLGEADMENLAASILAVSWYWRHRNHASLIDYTVFYAIVASGAQCKGLTAVIVPFLALLPDLVQAGRARQHLNARHVIAMLIGAAIYLLPFWLAREGMPSTSDSALSHSGLAQVLRENIVRYFAPFDHTEPFYTYLVAVPQYLFPWSFVFIFALYQALRDKTEIIAQRGWLLSTLSLIFLFFTLSGSRRNYYILPLLPYCALLIAVYLHNQYARTALRLTAALLIAAGVLHLLILPLWPLLQRHAHDMLPDGLRWNMAIIGTAIMLGLALCYWRAKYSRYRLLYACTFGSVIWLASFFFFTQLILDSFRSEVDFARQLASMLPDHPGAKVATYRERPGGRLLFYARLPPTVTVLKNPDALREFIADSSAEKIVIVYHQYDPELPDLLRDTNPQAKEKEFAWEKNNKEKLQAWLLPGVSAE